jgi:NADPH2:quinone reductase
MIYIDVREPGGPDVLVPREGEQPEPMDGEVLIKVAAAGVNRPDILQRKGLYPPPPNATPILGLEVAGEIAALGKQASRFRIGDKVCALTNGGGYAEYINVPETQCLPVPEGLSMVEAAALPETFFTVWSNVFDRAGLQPGESFLVHGGSSGIGTTAIQLARAFGARVFTTAGNDEKCQACENLGAEIAINYKQTDFVEVLKAATSYGGVDVILDMVGGDYIPRNIQLAAPDGRIVSIAFLGGPIAEVNFAPVMLKRLTLTGSTLRPRSAAFKARIATSLREKVWPLIESGKIKPQIFKVFSFEDAKAAHGLMESSKHIGKIILSVDQES